MPAIPIPAWLAGALSLLAGAASIVCQAVFPAGSHWAAGLTVGLVFLAYLGIPAVTGGGFQALLAKLIPAKYLHPAHAVLAAIVAAATLALTLTDWSQTAHAIVAGVVTVLVGLGFGPVVAAVAVKSSRRKPHPA